jgi:hypothetical protein
MFMPRPYNEDPELNAFVNRRWINREKRLNAKKKTTTPLAIGFWVGVVAGFLLFGVARGVAWLDILSTILLVIGIACGTGWFFLWSPAESEYTHEDGLDDNDRENR